MLQWLFVECSIELVRSSSFLLYPTCSQLKVAASSCYDPWVCKAPEVGNLLFPDIICDGRYTWGVELGLFPGNTVCERHGLPEELERGDIVKALQNEGMISLVCYEVFLNQRKWVFKKKNTSKENLSPLAEWHFMPVHIVMSVFEKWRNKAVSFLTRQKEELGVPLVGDPSVMSEALG